MKKKEVLTNSDIAKILNVAKDHSSRMRFRRDLKIAVEIAAKQLGRRPEEFKAPTKQHHGGTYTFDRETALRIIEILQSRRYDTKTVLHYEQGKLIKKKVTEPRW